MELSVVDLKDSVFDYDTMEFKSKKPVIIDLFTDWCTSCKVISKPLDTIAEKYKDVVDIIKVNITTADRLVDALEVQSVPTLLFFKPGNNKPLNTMVGGTPSSIEKAIDKFIEGD